MESNENMIEFLTNDKKCTVTFTNRKHINRIKKIHEERRDDFSYFFENEDGSVCAKIPLKWIKINPGSKETRTMTDEQREAARKRLSDARMRRNLGKT
jgi:hypothetical protein